MQSCVYGGQSHTSGTLDVIVEAGDPRCVLVQDSPSVWEAEVFKVNVCFGIALPAGRDEAINEGVVFFASYPRTLQAQVQVVVEKLMVIRANLGKHQLKHRCIAAVPQWAAHAEHKGSAPALPCLLTQRTSRTTGRVLFG